MTFEAWFALIGGALKLLGELAPGALEALKGGASHEEALAAARAELPAPLDTSAEDAARRARVRAQHPRISGADASTLRRLSTSAVLTDEEREALERSAAIVETHAEPVG